MSVDSRHGSVNVTLQGKHRKTPGLECGLTSEAVAIDSYGPVRAGSSGLEKATALTVLMLNYPIVDSRCLSFPCQARESGLPVTASPVPAWSPHGFRGMTGRTTNHSTLGRSPECCQTPDIRYANVVAVNRWLSAIADLPSAIAVSTLRPLALLQIASEAIILL